MLKQSFFFFFLLGIASLQAVSIRLHNEANCPLKAIIYGADGVILSEVVVDAQGSSLWSDTVNPLQKGNLPAQGSTRSRTPFTVHWECLDGKNFCILEDVSTGAFVSTAQGTGKKTCAPPHKTEVVSSDAKE